MTKYRMFAPERGIIEAHEKLTILALKVARTSVELLIKRAVAQNMLEFVTISYLDRRRTMQCNLDVEKSDTKSPVRENSQSLKCAI